MGRIWQWSVALIYIILIVNDEPVSCQGVVSSCGCQSQYVNNQQTCNNGIDYSQISTINGPSYGSSVNQGAVSQIGQATLQGGHRGTQQNIQTIQSPAATSAANTNPILSSPNLPCRSPSPAPKLSACAPSISQRLFPQCLSPPSIKPPNPGCSPVPRGCGQTQPVYPNLPPNLCGNCGSQPNLYQPAPAISQASAIATSQASVNEVISSGYPSDITQLNSIASSSVQSNNIQASPYVPQQFVNQYPVRPPCGCLSSPVRYPNPRDNCQCQQSPQAYPINQQPNIVTEQSVATAISSAIGQQNIASAVQNAAVNQQSTVLTGQSVQQSAVALTEQSTVVNQEAGVSSQQSVASAQQTSVVNEETASSQQAVASTQQVVAGTEAYLDTVSIEQGSVASSQSEVSSAASSSLVEQSTAVAAVDTTTTTTSTQEAVASSQSTSSSAAQSSVVASTTQLLPMFIQNPTSGSQILPINVPTKILLKKPCNTPTPPPSPPCPIYPPIQPIIVQNSNSNSNMKTLLPIFIAALFNDGGGCGRGFR